MTKKRIIPTIFLLSIVFFILQGYPELIGVQALIPKCGKNGMVVCTNSLASKAGIDILKKGGNAIDAAVAVGFALAVTYPSCGNIGGGGFLLYSSSKGIVTSIDFRIIAPLSSTRDMYIDKKTEKYKKSQIEDLHILDSPLSIGVPGTVAGLALAHERYGSLRWSELIAPAIELAEKGFPVSRKLHQEMKESKKYFLTFPSSTKFFLKKDKTLYEPGEIWKQPQFGKTLRRIQEKGKDEFYKGETAKLIVSYLKQNNGLITMEDLARYRAIERKPIRGTYRGYDIYAMSPPSSGGVTQVQILNILEGYNLPEMGHNSALYLHLLTESMRRAFKDRAQYLGDPEFYPNMPIKHLISKEYAQELRKTIALFQATPSDQMDPRPVKEGQDTTHFSVADSEGNAVTLTYSLNGDFGAYVVPDGTGVVLNNTMGDFDVWHEGIQSEPNLIEPGKRPLSSMTPTIIAKDGKPIWIIGSPGGPTIITTNLQITLNLIDFKMNIAEAVSSPRIYHGWKPDETYIEQGATTIDSLRLYEMMGHKVRHMTWHFGPAMCIHIDSDQKLFYGAADPRSSDGVALGF